VSTRSKTSPRPEGGRTPMAVHEQMTTLTAGSDQSLERDLLLSTEPVGFAYFDLESLGEDDRRLHWGELAHTLRDQGASVAATATIAARVAEAVQSPATLAVFAGPDGDLLHEQLLTGARPSSLAGCTAPARIAPLLAWKRDRPAYVLVVIDRTGADITAGSAGGANVRHWSVEGPDDEIERNAPGGWSQPRYQRRAEDSWRHNAGRVATEVARAAAEVHAQALVVSGDVRAVQLLTERLPRNGEMLVRHISGSRSPDGSQLRRAADVERALREVADEQTGLLLDELRLHLVPDGRGVEGPAETIGALAAGRVSTLFVVDEPRDERVAWFGSDATDVYADRASAVAAGRPVQAGRLADVAIRAALLSDAYVRVLDPGTPGQPGGGVGALCRFVAD
jgi:hypothetical protein